MQMLQKGNKPRQRGTYGVPHGVFRGEIFCYIEEGKTDYYFLSLPKMIVRVIPKDKFDFAIKNSIIEFIEELPKKVYKVLEAQYKQSRKLSYGKFDN